MEDGVGDLVNNQLGDSISLADAELFFGVVVDHDNFYLAPVPGVNNTGRIYQCNTVFQGQSTAGHHIGDIPIRKSEGDPGIHKNSLPRGQHMGGLCNKVRTRITGMCVEGHSPRNEHINRIFGHSLKRIRGPIEL